MTAVPLPLSKPTRMWLLVLCAVVCALRFVPLAMHGVAGFGYDTGFYRGFMLSHVTPPDAGAPLLGDEAVVVRVLLRTLSYLPLPADVTLLGSYTALSVLLGLLVFAMARQLFGSDRSGLIALLLFALSPTQWTAFVLMLYKQMFAAPLLLSAIYLAGNGTRWFLLPLAVTAASHRTTIFLAAPVFSLHGLQLLLKRGNAVSAGVVGVIVLAAAWLNADALRLLAASLSGGTRDYFHLMMGDLMSVGSYLRLSLPYSLVAVFGAVLLARRRVMNAFVYFACCAAMLVLLRTPFHQRIIFFLDLVLIILAAGGLSRILERVSTPRGTVAAIAAYTALLALFLAGTMYGYRPIVTDAVRADAEMLRGTEPGALLMTDSKEYGSLLYGWAGPDKRIISPGLLWDRWQPAQWSAFWYGTTGVRTELLTLFGEPVYLFSPENIYADEGCFRKYGAFTWKFVCAGEAATHD